MFRAIHISHTELDAADDVKSLVRSALMFIGSPELFCINDTSMIGIHHRYAFWECIDDQLAMLNLMDFWTHVQNIRLRPHHLKDGGQAS